MSKIYGVDLSRKITPVMVRDAIIHCFLQAHKEILDMMKEYSEFKTDDELTRTKRLEIEYIVKSLFSETNGDFDNPSKQDLQKVIDKLAELATGFRKKDIIRKHYNGIMRLIKKLD